MSRTKYVLIERPDCRPTAVTPATAAEMREAGEVITSERPITLAEVKRENTLVVTDEQWAWDMQQRARFEAFEAYRAKYHGVVTTAEVLSWDHLRGEGRVRLADGAAWDIYACNLPGRKTWYPETACVFYMPGETVQVKLDVHLTRTFVIGVTPGYPDNEKWESLDHSRLAFVCNESGEATSGLFAPGAGI
jgi:hypothetical protein